MVTGQQVRLLFKLMQTEPTLTTAAAKAGMNEKTARKYRRFGKLPSAIKSPHDWSGHEDAFADVWPGIEKMLKKSPGLEAKTLFNYLKRCFPDRYSNGQLRTLQRRVKTWRATKGPAKEVFFSQKYRPGERSQSDFTRMGSLGITIANQRFDHLIYHFTLAYSNWETGSICFSESFESLSEGLQNALYELGGVPRVHQRDSLSAAVRQMKNKERFTDRYAGLLRHLGLDGIHTTPRSPNENGDIEQRNRRFKDAVGQSLLLRGSSNVESRQAYGIFLDELFVELNRPRRKRFLEEMALLRSLPSKRIAACQRLEVRVRQGSTISVAKNIYSVHLRLVGEKVDVRLYHDHIAVYYAQRKVEEMPRLRGSGRHRVAYRHVIDTLVRKPGAFADYIYKADLFPTHLFRMAYDVIHRGAHSERSASRRYLEILHLAATENQAAVEGALSVLIRQQAPLNVASVRNLVEAGYEKPLDIEIAGVELAGYDALLSQPDMARGGVAI